jgi:hypothetical protein
MTDRLRAARRSDFPHGLRAIDNFFRKREFSATVPKCHERPCENQCDRKARALQAGRSSNTKHNRNMSNRRKGGENFFAPGGRRNSLKRLNPDKEIKGNQSLGVK